MPVEEPAYGVSSRPVLVFDCLARQLMRHLFAAARSNLNSQGTRYTAVDASLLSLSDMSVAASKTSNKTVALL